MLFNHYVLGCHLLTLIVPERNWDTGKKKIYSISLSYNTLEERKILYFINPTGSENKFQKQDILLVLC